MSISKFQPANPTQAPYSQDLAQRLARARDAVEYADHLVRVSAKKILKSRALALAQEVDQQISATEFIEVVEFLLAGEHYAIESQHIREVHPLERLTPLPCTPAFVLGIINLRGEMLSIIDMKKFFDLPDQGLTDLNKVIVLQSEQMIFGVLADAIIGVRQVSTIDIQSGLPTLKGIREAYLWGVTPDQTVILDAKRILFDPKIVVNETVKE